VLVAGAHLAAPYPPDLSGLPGTIREKSGIDDLLLLLIREHWEGFI
jgi:hypothetical protein